jgi:deoxyribonuclease V
LNACFDVDYRKNEAVAACVLFRSWTDEHSSEEWTELLHPVEAYEPGQFYRRELPCLLAVLRRTSHPLETVVIDGYVWLKDADRPGLGAHLYEALGRSVAVVGVAKTHFATATAEPVLRGRSRKPLFVTAAGMDRAEAAQHIQRMHGPYRVPTLLRRVDQLCRGL